MAGLEKPSSDLIEASYKLIGGLGNQSSSPSGLFNGQRSNNWDTSDVMYWFNSSHYVEVELYEKCNLWRSGTTGWKSYTAKFKILKFNDSTNIYEDVTSNFVQNASPITENEWEKNIEGLEKGRYRFSHTSPRLDSEWFFERIPRKRLVIKNPTTNQNYSISDKTLILLPDDSENSIIEYGIEAGQEIRLDEDFDSIFLTQNTSKPLENGKVFSQIINTRNIKKIHLDY